MCFSASVSLGAAALWLTFAQPQQARLNTVLTQGFSGFSQVIWPLYIPLAVWLQVPAVAEVQGQHIAYIFPHFH